MAPVVMAVVTMVAGTLVDTLAAVADAGRRVMADTQ